MLEFLLYCYLLVYLLNGVAMLSMFNNINYDHISIYLHFTLTFPIQICFHAIKGQVPSMTKNKGLHLTHNIQILSF